MANTIGDKTNFLAEVTKMDRNTPGDGLLFDAIHQQLVNNDANLKQGLTDETNARLSLQAETTSELTDLKKLKHNNFIYNISTDNFPVLTANRRYPTRKKHNIQVGFLGDSYGWAQGADIYDDGTVEYSVHQQYPYANGFVDKLRKHLEDKFDWYKNMVRFGTTAQDLTGDPNLFNTEEIDNILRINHKWKVVSGAYGYYNTAVIGTNAGWFDYASVFGYEINRQRFGTGLMIMNPDGGVAEFYVDMEHHARRIYFSAVRDTTCGKIKIKLHNNNLGAFNLYTAQTTGHNVSNMYYKQKVDYPKIYTVAGGTETLLDHSEYVIDDTGIVIDLYKDSASMDQIYCVDYGAKQKARVVFSYAGANASATGTNIMLRGIIFDCNILMNFSMGGHSTGAWLGLEASYSDGATDHLNQIVFNVKFAPTLIIVQAPIVNEYLRQTSIAQFKSNLTAIKAKFAVFTPDPDYLFMAIMGDKTKQYEAGAQSAITYEDYFTALKEWCDINSHGLVDTNEHFKYLVDNGLDYDLLYDDDYHPSAFANAIIIEDLITTIDQIM